ncbi:hypothetical protein Y032_0387g479 [Ancylostoma ceylanicum]|uniref:Uncharacterized protein n=1 Tax=Ancylostoma ceylanicum TaxID=53326 RepID=A0A016RT70_9BILA|nr:hypothetical protein Y032_0387g479 [Ancylostoma ceylanicum]
MSKNSGRTCGMLFFKKKVAITNVKTGSGQKDVLGKWQYFKTMMFLLGNDDTGRRLSNVSDALVERAPLRDAGTLFLKKTQTQNRYVILSFLI